MENPTLFSKSGLSKTQLVLITTAAMSLFLIALYMFLAPAPLTDAQVQWLHKLDLEMQIKENQAEYTKTATEMNAKLDQLHTDNVSLSTESAQISASLGF